MNFNKILYIFIFCIIHLLTVNNAVFANADPQSPPIAVGLGGILNQQEIFNKSFERVDALMSLPQNERVLLGQHNKTAFTGAGQQVFSPTFIPDEKAGVWIKNYNLFENININGGSNVSNVAYGTIIGYDTDLKHFKNNFKGGLTFHVALTGSRENFDNVKTIDNLVDVGITGAVFKNDFFSVLTLDAAKDYTKSTVGIGDENYTAFAAGAAWKTGYNFEFKRGKYILQPSILATYNFETISDYKSSKGTNIKINPINAIQIIPGVKFIANIEGGWQPYLGFSYIWDIMDSPVIFEEGIVQNRIGLAPYCEYGGGIQRKWRDRYTGFGQVMARGGGRNGVSLYFGLRMALGK